METIHEKYFWLIINGNYKTIILTLKIINYFLIMFYCRRIIDKQLFGINLYKQVPN